MSQPPSASQTASDKDFRDQLRRSAIVRREALPAVEYARLNGLIVQHLEVLLERLGSHCLGFCWPFRAEPDLRGLVAQWLSMGGGRAAALPVVVARGAPLVFARWQPGQSMRDDAYGIPVPEPLVPCVPDLMLVPLNAFDAEGFRVGYGGGYFDRTLAALEPAPVTVGVGFELGRVESIRPQDHDRPLDWIVTEMGVFEAIGPGNVGPA